MTPHPYSVECETLTPTTRSYVREWFLTAEDAAQAKEEHQREDWQRVDLVPLGQIPGVSVTGRQMLAVGAMGPRRRRQSRKKGA